MMVDVVRLIDANELEKRMEERLNSLREAYGNDNPYANGFEEGCVAVEYAKTLDPVIFRLKGRWRKRGNEKKCSVCNFIYYSNNDDFNYCPNCGAKMEG